MRCMVRASDDAADLDRRRWRRRPASGWPALRDPARAGSITKVTSVGCASIPATTAPSPPAWADARRTGRSTSASSAGPPGRRRAPSRVVVLQAADRDVPPGQHHRDRHRARRPSRRARRSAGRARSSGVTPAAPARRRCPGPPRRTTSRAVTGRLAGRRGRGSRGSRRAPTASSTTSRIDGWWSVTCPPRRTASRGEATVTPRSARCSSASAIACSVSPTDFSRTAGMPTSAISSTMSATASMPTTAGCPRQEAADAGRRRVDRPHQERVLGAHPALDRLGECVEVALGDVAVGRGARAAVEVLVGAADRQVGLPRVELDRHRAARVREVPQARARRRRARSGSARRRRPGTPTGRRRGWRRPARCARRRPRPAGRPSRRPRGRHRSSAARGRTRGRRRRRRSGRSGSCRGR